MTPTEAYSVLAGTALIILIIGWFFAKPKPEEENYHALD